MTPEEAEQKRSRLRRAKPEYCNQWDEPPTRYAGEYGTVTLRGKCAYPATWEVRAGSRDFSCDVHLSHAVRAMSVLEGIALIGVAAREFTEPDPA